MTSLAPFTNLVDELANLHAKWEKEFPGTSAAIESLREFLIDADLSRRHARATYQCFHLLTEATGKGMHEWPPEILKHFHFLERRQAQLTRRFTVALQALQSQCATSKSTAAKSSDKPAEPPRDPATIGKVMHLQTAKIRIIDGKVVTSVDPDAAFWCREKLWDAADRFIRQFYFPDAVIPEPYAYVLTDNGITYEPATNISITYSPQEFARLCQLELDTASEHLLDGKRLFYLRHEYSDIKELPS